MTAGIFGSSYGLLQFVFSPLLGRLQVIRTFFVTYRRHSRMSRATGPDEQGTVHGALTGIAAIAETLVPVAASATFAWSLTYHRPGLVFLGAGAFAAAATILLIGSKAENGG